MENLNLLFYKTFYTKLGQDRSFEDDIDKKAKKLINSKFYKEDYKPISKQIAPQKFLLKTSYPGLLVGTGYAHGVDTEGDIKVGFSFDFVTGQPYIPGSSVKGLLRSYFSHPEVIRFFLEDNSIDIKALEKAVFGATNEDEETDGTDIFFDAVVRCGDKEGKVMGFDAITPHGKDLTKNPVPIKILKVMPDVVFEFSFNLKDSEICGETVTANQKKELFENLLINFGIGAKTNVGYGVLTTFSKKDLEGYCWPDRNAASVRPEQPRREAVSTEVSTINNGEKPIAGKAYNCTVSGVKEFGIFVEIEGTRYSGLIHISKLNVPRGADINKYFTREQKVIARFLGTNDKGQLSFGFVGER